MVGTVLELCTLEELAELEENDPAERARWVVSAPEPPGLWQNLIICSVKKTAALLSALNNQPKHKLLVSHLQEAFPVLGWFQSYNVTKFKADVIAGITIASLCNIPQSIGYATLAKLEPQYGLYTSVVPPLIYAVMGTSKDMVIGPVAVDSLLLSAMLQKLIIDSRADLTFYKSLVFTATFFAGIFQAAFGIFRWGFLVDFFSHAASVGFMSGSAIIFGLQQLKGLLGITNFTHKTDIISVMKSVCTGLAHQKWHINNFVLGCSCLTFVLITRLLGKWKKKLFWLPAVIAPLLAFIFSTLIVYGTKAYDEGVDIVRQVKPGFNPSSVHLLQFDGPYATEVAKIGLIVAVVGLTEAMAIGRSFASLKGYQLDANKEMVSLGSLTSCYVATGSLSRTAVNFNAGGETLVSNMVMAVTVMISLQLFTRFLYYTPMAAIASIILSALPQLIIKLTEANRFWKVDKFDFLACIGAFFGVLFLRVAISFAKVILVSIQPGVEILGRLPGTCTFCDVAQYPMVIKIPGVLIIRVKSAWLCFANANFISQRIMRWVTEEEEDAEGKIKRTTIKHVVLDMSSKCLSDDH
ncbi:hypothetical protein FH972_002699 [Carpinus fangiana]|uniref:STAS domain-containing protein n=1 Tax=Carpinus fangiana TaxID=176857 RepID=A0A5N6QIA0_9ROSI|nr:hypothetical protein FH972_002699 [Carpinus fangiana]